jgi:hypothetical protein
MGMSAVIGASQPKVGGGLGFEESESFDIKSTCYQDLADYFWDWLDFVRAKPILRLNMNKMIGQAVSIFLEAGQ